MEKGKLYVVATPIGNSDDITKRAADVLAAVGHIACEDTRITGILLKELGIKGKLFSYHEFNKHEASEHIMRLIDAGESVAVVSDAGTPCISDPGFLAVKKARQRGYQVIPVPGASACITAMSVSGFAADTFIFQGFLTSRTDAKRKEKLKELMGYNMTVILYEAPHRMMRLLLEINEQDPDREIFIGREMTKKYEQFLTGRAKDLITWFEENKPRGEFVVIINKKSTAVIYDETDILLEFDTRKEAGEDEKIILKDIAFKTGKSKSDIYKICKKKPRL